MMWTRRRGRSCAPPWWPANEPWPPRGGRPWRARRARFMGCMFMLFVGMFTLVALGVGSFAAYAIRRAGGPFDAGYAVPAFAWLIFVLLFAFGMRRVGTPVGNIVDAAERVADGDFTTRIEPAGPRFVRTVASAFNTMTERLQAHDRQRRELMADIAHELRTPLTVIQGRLEGVLDGVYPRDDERLAGVLEETRVLARLVEDLRTLANAETGVLTLQKEPTELTPLVHDVVQALSTDAGAAGVTVRVDTAADLPPLNIDPLRMREVLTNLLSNALRYTPHGGSVTVSACRNGERVTVAVADTGAGILPEDLPKIFDRFYKGRTSRGSGLGLTIARNLVAAHGGSIRAESDPGRGTTITFDLPLASNL